MKRKITGLKRAALRCGSGFACLTLLALYSPQALAAAPQEICSLAGDDASKIATTNAELQRASEAAEAILASARSSISGDRALEQLTVEEVEGEALSFSNLAAYCSAAGEAMRTARSGSASRAQSYFVSALAHAQRAENGRLRARIAYRLALVSRSLPVRPSVEAARRASSQTIQSLQLSPDIAAAVLNDDCKPLLLASLEDQSNWASSTQSLDCAALSAGETGQPDIATMSYLQGARISLSEADRRSEDRSSLLEDAALEAIAGLRVVGGIPDRGFRFELTARLLEAALDSGRSSEADVLRGLAALERDLGNHPSGSAWLYALKGKALLVAGDQAGAADQLRQAIYFESQRAQPMRLGDWYLLLSKADPKRREQHVMQAFYALEAIRPLLPSIDPVTEESMFHLRIKPVFSEAVEVQLSSGNARQDSNRVARAQEIIESLRQAEIQNVFGPDCVPPRVPVSPSDLKLGEVLYYPILLNDRVEILYASKSKADEVPQYRRLTVSEGADLERIEELVEANSFEIGYGGSDFWKESSAELYELLIKPIENKLNEGSTLIIVPDGILRRLPFASLQDADGKMLIERTRLSIAPSLAYTQPGDVNTAGADILAASLALPVELTSGKFAALEATTAEATMVASLGSQSKSGENLLLNFSRKDLVQGLEKRQVSILHLATHASFNGGSDRSFIVAKDEAIFLSELRELVGTYFPNGELLSLIVLSACETALGDDQASMGLAGAAIQAGAESALASLWEVDDAGTAKLMREFYQFYGQGQGRAEALRSAQLALIKEDGQFSDPRIWAAFTMLGAWR